MFRINEKHFEIEEATLTFEIRHLEAAKPMWGSSNKGIAWFVEVTAKETDEGWLPNIFCQFSLDALSRWTELEGAFITVKDVFNPDTRNHHGYLFIFGHENIYDCHFSLGARQENIFPFRWEGSCDIYAEEDGYDTNVPFEIETPIRFTGGKVYDPDPETARRMVSEFLDPRDFIQQEAKLYEPHENGRPMGTVFFEPTAGS